MRLLYGTLDLMFASTRDIITVEGERFHVNPFCSPPGGGGDPPVTLAFDQAAVRTSKLLLSTNGDTTQRFTNTLRANGTALSSGVSYRIGAPAGYTGPITLDSATGAVSFGRATYNTVTRSRTPERVTIEATYQGETASYSFTVTDHFSPRRGHTSVVVGGDIYVIGGEGTSSTVRNDIWKSADGGFTWQNVHANP